ncbi:hypothetical protein GCM10009665_44800 [Kitasatospora nipponensis]|uniref:CU044_5270 family protein n=1 Tax=Kitasatospora nipponensis TaxID=258049 RepID=A0ABP4H7R4_9ACTN
MAPADPVGAVPQDTEDVVDRILARQATGPDGGDGDARGTVPAGGRSRRRVTLSLAASAAVVLGAAAALTLPDAAHPAYAATPPPLTYRLTAGQADGDAAAELGDIARRASLQGAGGSGPGVHLRWSEWALWTSTRAGSTSSRVVPEELDLVGGPDGATLTRRPATDRKPTVEQVAPTLGREPTPDTADGLRAWLRARTPGIDQAQGMSEAAHDLLTERALTPPQRAALLRLIAGLPGLSLTGTVTDRAGRQGVAFSADSAASGLPTRYTFIVDPDTGRVLGQEATLTESAGQLNVPVPSVVTYDTYLTSDFAP